MDYFNKKYIYPGLDNKIVIKGILSILRKKELSLKNQNYSYFLNGARQSIYLACTASKKSSNSEVIVPLFTCAVVVSAIKEAGCEPIFYNSTWDDFTGKYEEINNLINKNTSLIIVQSTFGYSSKSLAKKLKSNNFNIPILDDRAHGDNNLGQSNIDPYDYLVYSFEQSKIITCGKGGLLISKKSLSHMQIKENNFFIDLRDILFLTVSYFELVVLPRLIGQILYKITWRIFFIKPSMSKKEITLKGLDSKPRKMSKLKQYFLHPQIESLNELKKNQLDFLRKNNLPYEKIEKVCTHYIFEKKYLNYKKIKIFAINGWFSEILHPTPKYLIKKIINENKYEQTQMLINNKSNIILSRRLVNRL